MISAGSIQLYKQKREMPEAHQLRHYGDACVSLVTLRDVSASYSLLHAGWFAFQTSLVPQTQPSRQIGRVRNGYRLTILCKLSPTSVTQPRLLYSLMRQSRLQAYANRKCSASYTSMAIIS